MKLRNKNTGEIVEAWSFYYGEKSISIKYFTDDGQTNLEYYSLNELNEDWEDYEPAEPLIKDEKARKAVRAWAEADDVTKVYVCAIGGGEYSELYAKDKGVTDGCIRMSIKTQHSVDWGDEYTIEELCGEEECES